MKLSPGLQKQHSARVRSVVAGAHVPVTNTSVSSSSRTLHPPPSLCASLPATPQPNRTVQSDLAASACTCFRLMLARRVRRAMAMARITQLQAALNLRKAAHCAGCIRKCA